jgi:ATP synthase protein I
MTRQKHGFIRIMSGFAVLSMLTTKLLSKYLTKQNAKQHAQQEAAHESLRLKPLPSKAVAEVDELSESVPEPLTASQAQALRDRFSQAGQVISPSRILLGQSLAGVLLALLAWCVTGKPHVAISVAYGAFSVVLPAALFARGLMSQFSSLNALTAGIGFFVWEFVKIVATLVLLAIAPKLVTDLDWLAMLIGLIFTMQVVFVLLWVLPKLESKLAKST